MLQKVSSVAVHISYHALVRCKMIMDVLNTLTILQKPDLHKTASPNFRC